MTRYMSESTIKGVMNIRGNEGSESNVQVNKRAVVTGARQFSLWQKMS